MEGRDGLQTGEVLLRMGELRGHTGNAVGVFSWCSAEEAVEGLGRAVGAGGGPPRKPRKATSRLASVAGEMFARQRALIGMPLPSATRLTPSLAKRPARLQDAQWRHADLAPCGPLGTSVPLMNGS